MHHDHFRAGVQFLAILCFFIQMQGGYGQNIGDLRLVNCVDDPGYPKACRLEFYFNGRWGNIGSGNWLTEEHNAHTACKQVGCGSLGQLDRLQSGNWVGSFNYDMSTANNGPTPSSKGWNSVVNIGLFDCDITEDRLDKCQCMDYEWGSYWQPCSTGMNWERNGGPRGLNLRGTDDDMTIVNCVGVQVNSEGEGTCPVQCGANEYNDGSQCQSCPDISTSDPGSTWCNCPAGYKNEGLVCDSSEDTICANANFRSSAIEGVCSTHSRYLFIDATEVLQVTFPNQIEIEDCVSLCLKSQINVFKTAVLNDALMTCLCSTKTQSECPHWQSWQSYKSYELTSGINCCLQSFNSANSDNVCTPCDTGQIADSQTECQSCPADTYVSQTLEECLPCPAGTFSAEGSTTCTCNPGSVPAGGGDVLPDGCMPCDAGQFESSGTCQDCPINSDSQSGATECACLDGYVGSHSTCTPCDAGQYKDATTGGACTPCPQFETSGLAASECFCIPGYGGEPCTQCSSGSYSSDEMCTLCPSGLTSQAGASTCDCVAGFVKKSSVFDDALVGVDDYSFAGGALPLEGGSPVTFNMATNGGFTFVSKVWVSDFISGKDPGRHEEAVIFNAFNDGSDVRAGIVVGIHRIGDNFELALHWYSESTGNTFNCAQSLRVSGIVEGVTYENFPTDTWVDLTLRVQKDVSNWNMFPHPRIYPFVTNLVTSGYIDGATDKNKLEDCYEANGYNNFLQDISFENVYINCQHKDPQSQCAQDFDAKVAGLQVYDRFLSDEEILAAVEAIKVDDTDGDMSTHYCEACPESFYKP